MNPSPDLSGPIGVFDSGVGGLSVLRHIRARLPREDLLFLADSGNAPYGDRSPAWIRARSIQLSEWLVCQGAKAIVVACNTATAAATSALRAQLALPVIAMEPAVKPATAATRSGVVGVLATTGTLESARFAALLDRFAAGIEVVAQPCTGLVEVIERGELDAPATRAMVTRFVTPLLARGADTIVLGCTHYPFVREVIAAVAGPGVTIVETGAAVARQVERRLAEAGLLTSSIAAGRDRLITTGGARAAATARLLWHEAAPVEVLDLELAPQGEHTA
jgi:glutamate racemase